MAQTVGKRGFSVLAYPSSDAASLVSLSLIFKYHEDRAQATLSLLHSSVFLQGFDDAQTFILQYDADDIIPGTIPLKPAAIALPQTRFAEIARSRSPQIRTLFLRLKSCCQIWYPFTGSIAPKPGFEAPFIQLANLAKATELCILFDYGWLRPESHSIFQRLVEHPEQLSGFPVDRYYKGRFRRGDASIFNLLEDVDAAVETAATTDDEEPPPYVEASSKRPRHGELLLETAFEQGLTRTIQFRPARRPHLQIESASFSLHTWSIYPPVQMRRTSQSHQAPSLHVPPPPSRRIFMKQCMMPYLNFCQAY